MCTQTGTCSGLLERGLEIKLNGPRRWGPHILNLSFPGVRGEVLLHALEEENILVSVGSACHSRQPKPSHVLQALGAEEKRLNGAIRFSLSSFNNQQEIEQTIESISRAVNKLIRV